jgi:hypothetical protein
VSFTAYVGLKGEARTVAEATRKVKTTLHKKAMLQSAQFESNQAVNEAVLKRIEEAEAQQRPAQTRESRVTRHICWGKSDDDGDLKLPSLPKWVSGHQPRIERRGLGALRSNDLLEGGKPM